MPQPQKDKESEQDYFPGTRVIVFDYTLYKDDVSTPLSVTRKTATVTRWYGKKTRYGEYSSLIDVIFDHDGRESKSHFANTTYITVIY